MKLVLVILGIICFGLAFLAIEVRGLRFEWLGFALWLAATQLPA